MPNSHSVSPQLSGRLPPWQQPNRRRLSPCSRGGKEAAVAFTRAGSGAAGDSVRNLKWGVGKVGTSGFGSWTGAGPSAAASSCSSAGRGNGVAANCSSVKGGAGLLLSFEGALRKAPTAASGGAHCGALISCARAAATVHPPFSVQLIK